MIILGVLLFLLGWLVFHLTWLVWVGGILAVLGLAAWVLGSMGHRVGPRDNYW